MEWIITILLFFAVIIIAAVLFVGWLVVAVVGGTFRTIRSAGMWMLGRGNQAAVGHRAGVIVCGRQRCQAENPVDARFCRRCGRMLPQPQRVETRRVAML